MSSNGVAVLLQVRRQGNLPVAAVIHNTRHPSRAPVVHLVNGRRHARYHPCVLKRRDPSSSDKWRGSSQGALADPTKRAARLAPRSVWRPSRGIARLAPVRSEEHTSELQSQFHLVCRLLLEKKKKKKKRKRKKTRKKKKKKQKHNRKKK